MMNIAVFVSGGGTNLQAIIDNIKNGYLKQIELSLVISSKDGVFALERAKIENIPYFIVSSKNYNSQKEYDKELIKILKEKRIELVVLAGFLSLLGPDFVSEYKNRIINIHPSLIPSFCGTGMYGIMPHVAAIEKGVKITGATVHFVDDKYDTGPIILQKTVEVETDDTPEILQKRVMELAEQKILPKALKLYSEGKIRIIGNKTIIEKR